MDEIKDLAKRIDALTLEQARELVSTLVNEYGYVLPTATTVAIQANEEPIKEEKTSCDVILTSLNDKKMQIIKAYNVITNVGLMKTKAFLESPLPLTLQTGLSKETAESIKVELETAGASITIQ